MSSGLLGLIELLLVFGLILWFGVSQLRALKKLDERDAARKRRESRDEGSGDES